jgi:hypothetical protein
MRLTVMSIGPSSLCRGELLYAILGREPEPAYRLTGLIGDVHFPNVALEEPAPAVPQDFARRDDCLPMRFVAIGKLNARVVGEVSAIVHVEKVSGHGRGLSLPARIRITYGMPRGGPTKTIGQARAAGETRFTIFCERHGCGHRAELAFDQLRLPDSAIFVHIPQLLNFVCSKCGSRDVKVMPIFPPARGQPAIKTDPQTIQS